VDYPGEYIMLTPRQSGGIFWAVEGAVLIGYPQASKVGRYLGVWLAWRNAGSLIGASINLGLNIKTRGAGSLSPSTYVSPHPAK